MLEFVGVIFIVAFLWFVYRSHDKVILKRLSQLEEQVSTLQKGLGELIIELEDLRPSKSRKRKPTKAREAVKVQAVKQPESVVKSEPQLPAFSRAGTEAPIPRGSKAKLAPAPEIARPVEPVEKISEVAAKCPSSDILGQPAI